MARDKERRLGLAVKNKSTFIIIVLIILFVIASLLFFKGYASAEERFEKTISELEEENKRLSAPTAKYEEATKEISIDLINSELHELGELATIEYLYTDAGKFEDPAEIFGKDLPFSFTTKSFIVKWNGVIKAGVKVEDITAEINDANKEIIVSVPRAGILSHEIDEDSIETLDEKNGLFNPIKIDDIREFDVVTKEAMEQRAIESGLLDKAYENAKEIICKLIDTDAGI